jgi:hypothetical protein
MEDNQELIDFLQDGDIVTLTDENKRFTFNKSKMILEDEPNTPFPIEIKDLKLHMIVDIERRVSVFGQFTMKRNINLAIKGLSIAMSNFSKEYNEYMKECNKSFEQFLKEKYGR